MKQAAFRKESNAERRDNNINSKNSDRNKKKEFRENERNRRGYKRNYKKRRIDFKSFEKRKKLLITNSKIIEIGIKEIQGDRINLRSRSRDKSSIIKFNNKQ